MIRSVLSLPFARPLLILCASSLIVGAEKVPQAQAQTSQVPRQASPDTLAPVVGKVDVSKEITDREIQRRLSGIFSATGRFTGLEVRVRDGVVFLDGMTSTPEDRQWVGDLSRNTEGVAAVLNRIEVSRPSVWDFGPAMERIRGLAGEIFQALPLVVIAIIVFFATLVIAKVVTMLARKGVESRTTSPLLRDLMARGLGILTVLGGLFLIFRVAGLTTIALTLVGGTGVLGIILGIAFREISENLLASVFLSVQNPFRNGDLVEIEGITGYVQRLMMRATILMTLDGNHVQIPNSTVYKAIIRNYTSNPNRREDFIVGIGYDESVSEAQEAAMSVLEEHPAVLKAPEPWVLVDSLGAATVNLKVYFWLDGSRHSWVKVRSSVIRLVKRSFQDRGITMPDAAREMIFPHGVSVTLTDQKEAPETDEEARPAGPGEDTEDVATGAETGLVSDAGEIEQQARKSRVPEEGKNLLGDG